jgi:aminobenzoyl-glutamate transport protein
MGTVISTMLPYSLVFLAGWTTLFVIWYALDIPMGPGAPATYAPPAAPAG